MYLHLSFWEACFIVIIVIIFESMLYHFCYFTYSLLLVVVLCVLKTNRLKRWRINKSNFQLVSAAGTCYKSDRQIMS